MKIFNHFRLSQKTLTKLKGLTIAVAVYMIFRIILGSKHLLLDFLLCTIGTVLIETIKTLIRKKTEGNSKD